MSEPQDAQGTPWPDISYVTRSRFREAVVEHLDDHGPDTPRGIADATREDISSISHALSQLRARGLVELLVPDNVRKGRYYGITERGEHIHSEIEAEVSR